ncbi:MAG: hypothetical protein ACKO37_03850 [Vampirovibrionales bacterium]
MKLPTKLPSGLKKSVQKLQTTLKDPSTISLGLLGGLGLTCLWSVVKLAYMEHQDQQAIKTLVKQDYQKVGMSPPKDVQFAHSDLLEVLVRYNPDKSNSTIFVDNGIITSRKMSVEETSTGATSEERVSQYERERFKKKVYDLTKNDPRGPYVSTDKKRNCQLDVAANNVEWHFRAKLVPSFKEKYPNAGTFYGNSPYGDNRAYTAKCHKVKSESAKKGYPLETPEMFVKRVYP